MATLICTLFEGHYHIGAAALLNSLARHGFEGDFVCGYRGARPFWAASAEILAPKIRVHWAELNTSVHLTNYKPTFMQKCLDRHGAVQSCTLFYMDPDLVIKAPWSVFERWARDGIALVEDMNASMPAGHPYRLAWHDMYEIKSHVSQRAIERYYNAGFIGIPPQHTNLVKLWETIITWADEFNGDLGKLKHAEPEKLFHTPDQDALNMALELSLHPINAAGPEAMDFLPGGHLISHAAGGKKPWLGGFIGNALRGVPPGLAQKSFYDYVDGPIKVFSSGLVRRRRLELALAGFIGRFYCRH